MQPAWNDSVDQAFAKRKFILLINFRIMRITFKEYQSDLSRAYELESIGIRFCRHQIIDKKNALFVTMIRRTNRLISRPINDFRPDVDKSGDAFPRRKMIFI